MNLDVHSHINTYILGYHRSSSINNNEISNKGIMIENVKRASTTEETSIHFDE